MDIIEERRANIIKENNTAQRELDDFIENLNPNIRELNIQIPLSGILDLHTLNDRFPQLTIIKFSPGEITDVRNIPSGISHFECPGNLLVDLDHNLPGSLLYLNINNNYLKKLKLSGCSHLETLSCNDNRLEEFDSIPSSIKEIYCDNNEFSCLNLNGLPKLDTLHCSNNKIQNINCDNEIRDFQADNNPMTLVIETDNNEEDSDDDIEGGARKKKNKDEIQKDVDRKINYLDALKLYFRTKHEYDEQVLKKRRIAFKKESSKKMGIKAAQAVKSNCIYCNRSVGTIFYTDPKGYYAICGDKNAPCGLNIKLLRGMFSMNEQLLYLFKEDVDKNKESIIKHKLDALFNYMSDEVAVVKFKKLLEAFNEVSGIYEEQMQKYIEMYFSKEKMEIIHKKSNKMNTILEEIKTMVDDYRENENPETLKTAMELYVHDLIPEVDNLRRLKYEMVEMENNVLYQWPVGLQKMENNYLEYPEVVHFKGL
jgi:hypothetical protein